MSHADEPGRRATPPRMRSAARADSMAIEDVIKLASEGRLRIPSFQRPFRWDLKDRRDLLDSIYRGYPIGTLVLWKGPPSETQAARPLDPTRPGALPTEGYLVVDGQQRLTTLWEALGRPPREGESTLVFDLENEEVISRALSSDELEVRPPTKKTDGLPQVPLYLVLDPALLSAWVPQWLTIEDRRQYYELGKRLREYKVGLYIVENADIDTLRHVFDRINTTGKPMLRGEVFNALIGSRNTKDGETGLALVNAWVADLGFGAIESSTILKVFEAIRGDQVGRLEPRTLDPSAAEPDLSRTAFALQDAIYFLKEIAHIPHHAVCPYELPLVVLARFFALHPKPSERNLILLRRWLWRGALGDRLTGSMQQHVDDVTGNEDASVQALLARTGSSAGIDISDWNRTVSASIESARGKMLLCALLARQPRSLLTGERLSVGELFGDEKQVLRPIVREAVDGTRSHGVANKLLHPAAPVGPRQLILDCTDEAALVSHGIDAGAAEALRRRELDAFFARRSDELRRSTEGFFSRHAELERDDAPSLSAMTRRSA